MTTKTRANLPPSATDRIQVQRVDTTADRDAALAVLDATYCDEKGWVDQPEQAMPASELADPALVWYLARADGEPAGVLRLLDPVSVDLYRKYNPKMLVPGVDVEAFLRAHHVAEVSKFAVAKPYRRRFLVAALLMRTVIRELIEREVSHVVTESFEGEPTSPHWFLHRFLGFQSVATHDTGELNCERRRLISLVDIAATYRQARQRSAARWIFRFLTEGWSPELHARLQGETLS